MVWSLFTEEEIEKLKSNPYIKNITEKGITYTEEFRELFATRIIINGEPPSTVLRSLGIEPKILGKGRVDALAYRARKFAKRSEGFKDTRKDNPKVGRQSTKDLTPEERINKLEHEKRVLKQENEFLKKMIYLAKKVQWEKSRLEKNTK